MLIGEALGRASFLNNEDVARRAFDAVAAAQKVETLAELNIVLGQTFQSLGFDIFMGVNAVDSVGRPNVEMLFGQPPQAWHAHYEALGFEKNDAVIREMLTSTDPLFWSDLQDRRLLDLKERRILDEAGDFGLKNGFMTPMHNIDGSISAVLLMGSHVEHHDPDLRAAAHLLSLYYGGIGQRLHSVAKRRVKTVTRLSARQRECLQWVRMGKSSADIGDLLGISAHTVNHHIGEVCAKLGVRTRVQAVAEAAIHGLVEL